jgi:hypothetical protein
MPGSSRQPGSNRNDSGRRHRSKRKKLLRARAESPKIGACLGAAFYAVMRLRFYGWRNCTNQRGPVCSTGTNFCFARLLCNNFELLYFMISISKIKLAEGRPCRAAAPQIGRVGGATRLFQSAVKNLEGFGRPPTNTYSSLGPPIRN